MPSISCPLRLCAQGHTKPERLSSFRAQVDLSTVAGSGPNGRITATDVERAAGRGPAAPAAAPAATPAARPASAASPAAPSDAPAAKPAAVSGLRGTIKPFTALQNAVNKNMIASLAVPEFRVSYDISTDKMDALYQKLKPKVSRGDMQFRLGRCSITCHSNF